MTLLSYLKIYGRDREIGEAYEYQLTYAINRFSNYLNRPAEIADLSRETVNLWLREEHNLDAISPRSRSNCRVSILTLWNQAAEDGLAPVPHRIRPVKVPETIPDAWTFEQVDHIADAANSLPGRMVNGVPKSLYFRTLIWTGYETGLRRKDLFRMDISNFRDSQGGIVQHKTGDLHIFAVTPETSADLHRIAHFLQAKGDKHWRTPLRLPGCMTSLYYWMRKVRQIADIDAGTRNRVVQHLRRTGATQVEIERPGTASRYLGHRSGPSLARKSYVDRRLIGDAVLPGRTRKIPGRTRDR